VYKKEGRLYFSPTDLTTYFRSPFASWMERSLIENPGSVEKPDKSETLKLLAVRGTEHEIAYLNSLKASGKDVVEIARTNFEDSHKKTIEAMKRGHAVIFQAALKKDEIAGYADFIVRREGASKLGDYFYEAWDTKLSRKVKPDYALQLCAYSEMLEVIQGKFPHQFAIVLGNQKVEILEVEEYIFYYRRFLKRFREFHSEFSLSQMPTPQAWENCGVWEDLAHEQLKLKDHLALVAGISSLQMKRLNDSGITTKAQLAVATPQDRPEKIEPPIYNRLVLQAKLQTESEKTGAPKYEVIKYKPLDIFGLARLPPPHEGDIYFDMEGYPLIDGGLEYLFGACYLEVGKKNQPDKWKYKDWWALSKRDEKVAFEEFVDWAFKRYKKFPQMKIYHYASYEVSALSRLMCVYMTRDHEVDELLANNVFVDLYKIVKEGLIVGEDSYSIKKLERHYSFKREGEGVQKATDSILQFASWIELHDGDSADSSKILKEIRDYNEDDCRSTIELATWLRKLQAESGITYLNVDDAKKKASPPDRAAEILAEELLARTEEDPERAQIQRLFAGCLGYHRREAKPEWWTYHDRKKSRASDLIEDLDCLAVCKIISNEGRDFKVTFNPSQQTKLGETDEFELLHDTSIRGIIKNIDLQKGEATLEILSRVKLPNPITLIPKAPFSGGPMAHAIYEVVSDWQDSGAITPALKTLLLRDTPDIKGIEKGSDIYRDEEDAVALAIDLSLKMDHSVLAIQGPPGTGKTYTASHVIANLIKNGKKVGITSNSHKAINLLLEKSFEALQELGIENKAQIYKVRRDIEIDLVSKIKCRTAESAKDFWANSRGNYNLVGGTSWFFAAQDSIEQFDYLFIEEAGQFSLANAVAAQRSAKNLILLGDQMQLEQPIQGAHPDELHFSVLGHYLHGHHTVPPNMGIFLRQSRRMREEICNFISSSFYESRLHAHEVTKNNTIDFSNSSFQNNSAGIKFIISNHEGNTQGSLEEVDRIKKLVEELKGSKVYQEGREPHELTIDDILFVAPYNLQVAALKDALGEHAKVGSVDLFQGQEAPVVIISMCASDGDASMRGLEFLLSPNRLNVALSRAKTLALVVACPKLGDSRARTIEKMKLVNLFCKLCEYS
jgi:predicted RecB family nuclease